MISGDNVSKKENLSAMIVFLETVYPLFFAHTQEGVKALNGVFQFLLDDELPEGTEDKDHLKAAKDEIRQRNFDVQSMRKAFQLFILQAFKDDAIANALMTPDGIGYFISYLIDKLYDRPPMRVMDPFLGTGNLLATLAEGLPETTVFSGIEYHDQLIELARNYLDALDITHTLYHQDSFSFKDHRFDLIVTDFPIYKKDSKAPYLPYYGILHHLDHLEENQFMICLIENDFFDTSAAEEFKKTLQERAHLFGLLKLDESLFKAHPKSILILQKKSHSDDQIDHFLVAEIPAFDDLDAMEEALVKLNTWFKDRKDA